MVVYLRETARRSESPEPKKANPLPAGVQASEVERNQALYATAVNERARDVAAQLLYSYKLNPRSALYAGYSQGGFSDDDYPGLFSNGRSLVLKLSYAWQPLF